MAHDAKHDGGPVSLVRGVNVPSVSALGESVSRVS